MEVRKVGFEDVDSSGSGWGSVMDLCEHSAEHPGKLLAG
jgi:hypothetical protein